MQAWFPVGEPIHRCGSCVPDLTPHWIFRVGDGQHFPHMERYPTPWVLSTGVCSPLLDCQDIEWNQEKYISVIHPTWKRVIPSFLASQNQNQFTTFQILFQCPSQSLIGVWLRHTFCLLSSGCRPGLNVGQGAPETNYSPLPYRWSAYRNVSLSTRGLGLALLLKSWKRCGLDEQN